MKMWLYPLWVIVNVLVGLSAMALWVAAPEYKTLNISLTVFAISLGIVLSFIKWDELKLYIKSNYFKHVLYHAINAALILAIVGVVNYLGNKNFQEFDLSKEKRNSLTDQTLKVMELIKSPLTMTVYSKREEWLPVLSILKLFEAKNKQIKLAAIDTDVRPDLVKSKGITENGTVIVEYGGKETSFVMNDELSVTNALLKALREEQIKLYVVTGHQELSCDDKSQEGVSALCEKLAEQNYEVKNLDLTKTKSVPADASAVLIFGPISGYLPQEAKQLEQYLNQGGSLFLALAPAFKAELYDNLTQLAKPFGLKLGKDVVIDRLSTVQGAEATIPIVNNYEGSHAITKGFHSRTVFPLSSSVSTIQGNDSATILAKTSSFPGSWAETDLKEITKGKALYEEGKDVKGPIGLIGVGEKVGANASGSRFILLGSSSFLINAYQSQAGNSTLFLNSLSWMVNDEGIISFNRPGIQEEPVILSSQHLQMIFIISILFIPIVFFGCGIFVYRRRRLL